MFDLPNELGDVLQFDADTRAVSGREGKRREFKRSFVNADFSEYTKVLAAFANADGGILLFGISDRPRELIGIEPPTIPDDANWSNRLREDFDPELPIATRVYHAGGVGIFAVGIDASPHKPVLCRRNRSKQVQDAQGRVRDVEVLREGTIYYRYSGQARAIGFNELSALLDERDRRRMRQVFESLKVMQKVGFDQAAVIDLKAGEASSVFVSRETAKDMTLIDRANLVQDKGAPAYVMVGQVQLGNVVRAPLDEADKNIPTEAANRLRPLVAEVYGDGQRIHAAQVTQLLKHLNHHDDDRYCVQEKKLGRKYITREGIAAIGTIIRERPLDAIKVFGSKDSIARYERKIAEAAPRGGGDVG